MNFKQWLNENTKDDIELLFYGDPPTSYISPVTLHNDDAEVTFIYTNDKQLFTAHGKTTHNQLIMSNKILYGLFNPYIEKQGNYTSDYTSVAEKFGLLGRIGHYNNDGQWKIASFWGREKQQFDQLLIPCVQALVEKKMLLLKFNNLISTPFHKTVPVQNILNNSATTSHMDAEKYELYKKLHLMRGAEKQQAMKVLGVGGGGKPHPMATAMQQANLLKPGQKWWAPTSETNIL